MRTSLALAALLVCAIASAQTDQTPVKPPPIPTGVIPLPQGPPPTGLQQPLPKPAQKLPDPLHPLAWSPDLPGIQGYASKQPITIQQAVAIALYTSKPFATAMANFEQAAARAGEARAEMQPNLSAAEQITEFDAPTTVNFGGQQLTVVPQFNPVFTAALTLPIDIFGALHSAADQAHFNEVAARIDVNRVRNQVAYDVKTAFYNVLRAQAQLLVVTNSLNNALARLGDANKNYSAGTTSRFDVITAQRDVADGQQSLITAKAQVTINLAALKNSIGLSINTRLNISDRGAVETPPGVEPPVVPPVDKQPEIATPPANLEPAAPSTSALQITPVTSPSTSIVEDDFDWGPEFQALIAEASKNRPEILEAEAQVTAGQKGLQYARRSILPTFDLSVEDEYTANPNPFTRINQGIFGLNIKVPIYDGGLARERVKEQRANVALAEVNRRQAADQIQIDVQQAYIALVQARQKVAVSNVEASQARESFRVSQVRYRAGVSQQTGVSPQLELSNAQISLAQAESNQVNALYDYNNARAQLDRAVGRYAFTGSGPGFEKAPSAPTH